jgi:hypothetical protein
MGPRQSVSLSDGLVHKSVVYFHSPWSDSRQWQDIFLCSKVPKSALDCTQLHIQRAKGTLSSGVKRPGYGAVPWLRRLVAGLSPRRPGFDPDQSMWDLWWTKWQCARFFPEYFGFPLSISFHRCYITRKNEKTLIIFIIGLHNKPEVCGASVAPAAGPFTKKKSGRGMTLATYLHVGPTLKMSGSIPPVLHIPSWRVQGTHHMFL